MSQTNCYTFDAETGELTDGIQLEKQLGVHHVETEEHNREKKKVRACPQDPPKNFCPQKLRLHFGCLKKGHIAEPKRPHAAVLLHVINSHKIKARKDSAKHTVIHGDRTALVQISKGHGVTVHNSQNRWAVRLPENSMEVLIANA